MPTARCRAASFVLGGKIYVAGGELDNDDGDSCTRDVTEVYDPSTDSWATVSSLPAKLKMAGGCSLEVSVLDGDGAGQARS
jgi:N-acetylneuraminic acid mutarotase